MSDEIRERARLLHAEAIVVDCHSDILMPVAEGYVRLGREVPLPDPDEWTPPFPLDQEDSDLAPWPKGSNFGTIGQYSIPQFVRGGVTAEVCAVFVEDHRLDAALRRSLEMVWWMHREVEENEGFELITTAADIRRLKKSGSCGAVLALEGFEPLGYDLKMLDLFHRLGVRMGGLIHNRRNYFADGTQYYTTTGGLTSIGKGAVRRMNELGMVVDLGHLNQVGYWEALELSSAPAVLSHRSPRAFFPLDPEQSRFYGKYDVSRGRERLEALAKNGGVFGVFFLGAETVADVVDDIEHVINVVGSDHVGLGSDLYGVKRAPRGLEDISKVPAITEEMIRRGHSDEVILKVLGENLMRVFESVWGN